MKSSSRIATAVIAAVLPMAAAAQNAYPSKPIHVILPVGAGTGVDVIVRKAGETLLPSLGQPFVVENRASANMVTGADACAKSPKDGHAMCALSSLSIAYNPLTISSLPYDAEKDFRPVINMFFLLEGLIAKAALPVNSIRELQALALARRGELNFGTLGPGSTTDISRQWLEEKWGAKIAGIHYKGGSAVVQALAAGEIDFSRIGAYNALALVRSGRVKLLALGGDQRSHLFPEVPTNEEAGLAGIPPSRPFWALFMPAGVPDAAVRRINTEFVRLFQEKSFLDFLDTQVVIIGTGTPEDLAALVRRERDLAAQIVKKYNIPKQ
jgi:tripartite-type tricarboxylate transporter receptor subunit TctC